MPRARRRLRPHNNARRKDGDRRAEPPHPRTNVPHRKRGLRRNTHTQHEPAHIPKGEGGNRRQDNADHSRAPCRQRLSSVPVKRHAPSIGSTQADKNSPLPPTRGMTSRSRGSALAIARSANPRPQCRLSSADPIETTYAAIPLRTASASSAARFEETTRSLQRVSFDRRWTTTAGLFKYSATATRPPPRA